MIFSVILVTPNIPPISVLIVYIIGHNLPKICEVISESSAFSYFKSKRWIVV